MFPHDRKLKKSTVVDAVARGGFGVSPLKNGRRPTVSKHTGAYVGIEPSIDDFQLQTGNWCRGGLMHDCNQNPDRTWLSVPMCTILHLGGKAVTPFLQKLRALCPNFVTSLVWFCFSVQLWSNPWTLRHWPYAKAYLFSGGKGMILWFWRKKFCLWTGPTIRYLCSPMLCLSWYEIVLLYACFFLRSESSSIYQFVWYLNGGLGTH